MKLRSIVLAGAATVLVAGGAMAATGKLKTMQVALPDGGVAQIAYIGEVAPSVTFVPAMQDAAAMDPFAELEQMQARMAQQHMQMMQQVADMQRQAAAASTAQPGQVVVSGAMPAGATYNYTVVTSSSANGQSCTQTVEYSSDGKSAEPMVTRASSGDCDAVKPNDKPVPAAAPKPQEKPFDPRTI
jgi:hypothetical protein